MTAEEFLAKHKELVDARTMQCAAIYATRLANGAAGISTAFATWQTAYDACRARYVDGCVRAGIRWRVVYSHTVDVTARDEEHADELAYEEMETHILRDQMDRSDFWGSFELLKQEVTP